MNPVIVPNSAQLTILTELVDTGNFLDVTHVMLLKTALVPNSQTTLAACLAAEADFDGYVRQGPCVWGTPFVPPGGSPVVDAAGFTWIVDPAPVVLNTIYGWFLTDAPTGGPPTQPTVLKGVRMLDTPVILAQAGDGLTIVPAYPAYLPV